MKLIEALELYEKNEPSKPTGGDSKKEVERRLYSKQNFPKKPKRNDKVVALIGNPANSPDESSVSSIVRHLENYMRLGIKEENIIFAENDKATYQALEWAKDDGWPDGRPFKFKLWKGDIKGAVNEWKNSGIYLIDFDAMSNVNEDSVGYIEKFLSGGLADYMVYVWSQRGPGKKGLRGPINRDLLLRLSEEGDTALVDDKEVNKELTPDEKKELNKKYAKQISDRPEPDVLRKIIDNWLMVKHDTLPLFLESYKGVGGGGEMLIVLLES